MVKRWVHRQISTGKFAVSHGGWVSYGGTLREAKIYRNKNGGGYNEVHNNPEDFEWVEVELSLKEA